MEISPLLLLITREATELGAINALVRTGKLKPFLKKTEACRLFGRANVERWLDDGLITKRKDGSDSAAWRLERLELEIIARSIMLLKYD